MAYRKNREQQIYAITAFICCSFFRLKGGKAYERVVARIQRNIKKYKGITK